MKLICIFEQSGLTSSDGAKLSHQLYFDFVSRIGIDGKTPNIGLDGNWWIGSVNTQIPALAFQSYTSPQHFPNVGNSNILYLDSTANKIYRWNAVDLHYYVIGKNYDEIDIIDGGNA